MSYFITRRAFWRPDQPQAVYKSALGTGLWEATLFAAIAAATLNCSVRPPARASAAIECQPAFSWVRPVVDATVATWQPVFAAELGYRSPDRAAAAIDCQPQAAWIFSVLPVTSSVAQQWPAVHQATGLSYRSGDCDQTPIATAPAFSWVQPVVDATVRTWSPVFVAELGYRGPDRASAAIDCQPQPAWIFSALPVTITTAQQWPAIHQATGLSYRSMDRDQRPIQTTSLFSWVQSVVDATVRTWAAVWNLETQSFRSNRLPPLDVRWPAWSPDVGSWISTIPAPAVEVGAPACRTLQIGVVSRTFVMLAQARTFTVPAQLRTFTLTCRDQGMG